MDHKIASIVVIDTGKPRIARDKPSLEEQFEELREYQIQRFREISYGYPAWMIFRQNNAKHSPKCWCWLFREVCKAFLGDYEAEIMAKRTEDTKAVAPQTEAWGFVNVQLSDEERDVAEVQFQDSELLWETLVTFMRDGYKLTLSFDADTDSFCAALSGTHCGAPNERFTLTAWADDPFVALGYLAYKHSVKLEFVWNKPGVKPKRLG